MNPIYLYDGEFDGFLTCIYYHYYDTKTCGIYSYNEYEPQLFEETKYIKSEKDKAKKVYNAIISISEKVYWDVYYTFLSNNKYKDCYLLKYLELVFSLKEKALKLHTHENIYPVKRLRQQVAREKHKFLGILRFSKIQNILYSSIEPDHNIIVLLADHFSDRFNNEKFIIHDKKRSIAIISNKGKWILTDFNLNDEIIFSEEEMYYQKLWKNYFKSITIKSRKNKKLQQNFVPLKYRKNLIEFKD